MITATQTQPAPATGAQLTTLPIRTEPDKHGRRGEVGAPSLTDAAMSAMARLGQTNFLFPLPSSNHISQ